MLAARLRRWIDLRPKRGGADDEARGAPVGGDEMLGEIADLVRKCARGQVRVSAKLDEMEAEIRSGFARLQRAPASDRRAAAGDAGLGPDPAPGWGDVLDALDTLDHVTGSLDPSASPELAAGLRGVAERLKRALGHASIQRLGAPGDPVDASVLRVVGTDEREDWPDGVVTRVVRAAALANGRLLREGEVFVNKRSGS